MTAPALDRPAADDPHAEVWALVERAQAGDSAAFGQLYQRYADTVYRFVYFRVGNRPLAEDLAGEVWVRAIRRIGSFAWQGRDLGAWLITIARNLIADHFKSARYKLEILSDGAGTDEVDQRRGPEAAAVSTLTSAEISGLLIHLTPEQRECIVLRFFNDCSVAETALAMGRGEDSVKQLQHRAVRTLARHLPEGLR